MKRSVSAFAAAAAVLWNGLGLAAENFGTAEQARAMLDHATAAMKADEAAALKAFNDKADKQFHDRDLYVYCFAMADGKFTAYQEPFLLGADIRKLKLYGEPMCQQAFEGSVVTIAYKLPKPGTNKPVPKEAFETRIGDQACGVAYYK